ncbi:MAG: hypothetical protein AMXMBFR33_11020 [Candidatus Xenobia bacterium]
MKSRVVFMRPSPKDRQELSFLPERMQAIGYDEEGIREAVKVTDVCLLSWPEIPGYLWRCQRADTPRHDMIVLWLLNLGLERKKVERALGVEETALLLRRKLLEERQGEIFAQVDLYPCEGAYVFTDRLMSPIRLPSHVYELGKDSYLLARVTPRSHQVGRVLDLCTGSGVHVINGARHGQHVIGTDINKRAIDFARINLAMNQVDDRAEIREGSLYDSVAGDSFDLITANPPFHPTPDEKMQIYRTGGESGETLTEQLVTNLPKFLNNGGLLSMIVVYPILRHETYLARLQRWLGGGKGYGVALLNFTEMTREFFIQTNMEVKGDWKEHVEEFDRWMNSYERQGIDKIGVGNVFIYRLDGQPGWSAYHPIPWPNRGRVAPVEPWLEGLRRFHDPAWKPEAGWKPQLTCEVWARSDGAGQARWSDPDWPTPVDLTPAETAAARDLAGCKDLEVLRSLGIKNVIT